MCFYQHIQVRQRPRSLTAWWSFQETKKKDCLCILSNYFQPHSPEEALAGIKNKQNMLNNCTLTEEGLVWMRETHIVRSGMWRVHSDSVVWGAIQTEHGDVDMQQQGQGAHAHFTLNVNYLPLRHLGAPATAADDDPTWGNGKRATFWHGKLPGSEK